jgi:catechol 2,3-dioxygenase-like lactoylglutathione lyase family enzyme
MIDKIGLVCVWVLDHDTALDFYVGTLGFRLDTDITADGYRFVLVTAPEQPDVPLMLALPEPPATDPATAEQLKVLMAKGVLGPGSLVTKDCRKAYEELSARGVEFTEEPEDRFYGIDAGFRDPFGNQWRLTQLLPRPA